MSELLQLIFDLMLYIYTTYHCGLLLSIEVQSNLLQYHEKKINQGGIIWERCKTKYLARHIMRLMNELYLYALRHIETINVRFDGLVRLSAVFIVH